MVAARVLRSVVPGLITAAVLASLGACGFLTASGFPESATQIGAQRDLSPLIPEAYANEFTISAVAVGSSELVFAACSRPFDGTHLIVMNHDLQILQSFSYQDLITAGATNLSTTAVSGVAGDIVIMGLSWTPGTTGLSSPTVISGSPTPSTLAVNNGTTNFSSFGTSGTTLSYYSYTSTWTTPTLYGPFTISPTSTDSFDMIAAVSDPTRTDVIFILYNRSTSKPVCLLVPKADVLAGLAPSLTLMETYPSIQLPQTDNRLIAYSQNGFIEFQHSTNSSGGSFIRTNMSGALQSYSLRYTGDTDLSMASSSVGSGYYLYERTTRIVTRVAGWW